MGFRKQLDALSPKEAADPFFGPQHLPKPQQEFVVWLDVMGTRNVMNWSDKVGSANVGKLHVAVIESPHAAMLSIYPMIDGLYATCKSGPDMQSFLRDFYTRFTDVLLQRHTGKAQSPVQWSPLLKAGVARGEIYHGRDITESGLAKHPAKDSILLGKPIVWAVSCEKLAAPLGVYAHESAGPTFAEGHWQWWGSGPRTDIQEALHAYLDAYSGGSGPEFPVDSREKQRGLTDSYFGKQTPATAVDGGAGGRSGS